MYICESMWYMLKNGDYVSQKQTFLNQGYLLTTPQIKYINRHQIFAKRIWYFQMPVSNHMWIYQLCVSHTDKSKAEGHIAEALIYRVICILVHQNAW